MAQINVVSSKPPEELQHESSLRGKNARVEALQSDLEVVIARLVPAYENLTPAQRLAIRNTLDGWASATNAQKIDANHAVTGLYAAVLDLLLDEIVSLRKRVKALEGA